MVSDDDFRQLVARVESLEQAISSGASASTKPSKSLSVREFLNNTSISTQNDRIVAIGYYVEHVQGNGSFTNDDLKAGFAQAKYVAPRNISDALAQNARKGYIMESNHTGRTKNWVLTNSGEQFMQSKLLQADEG